MWLNFENRIFPRKPLDREVRSSLPFVIQDGILSQLIESLTGGPIAIALALYLGASNVLIGYLLALPFLCNLGQFPGILLLEKFKTRKILCLVLSSSARLSFLGVAILIFVPNIPNAPFILAFLYTFRYVCTGCSSSSWNSWMKDLIPRQILGRFFSARFMFMVLTSLIVSLTTAGALYFLPIEKNHLYGILVLIAGLSSFYGMYVFYHIVEPLPAEDSLQESIFKKFKIVFKDSNYIRLILFLGIFNFSINLAVPFFSVFVLERLGLNLSIVLILVTITQISSILVMRVWGLIADRFSNKSVLAVTGPLYVLSIFLFLFTNYPDKHILTLPLLIFIYFLVGIAQSGVTLATGNIALKLAPKGAASVYLSTNGILNACMAGTAPILGGLFADFFRGKSLSLTLNWTTPDQANSFYIFGLEYWDFFFFFATILGALSLSLLKQVKEEGEVNEKIVISSFIFYISKNLSPHSISQKFFLIFSQYWYKFKTPPFSSNISENDPKEIPSSELFGIIHSFVDEKKRFDTDKKEDKEN